MREAFGEFFDGSDGYLNTASIGIPPRAVAAAVASAVTDWQHGAARAPDYDPFVERSRAGFAGLADVPVESVAIGASVSQCVGLVAASLPDDARVLTVRGEYTSLLFPLLAQRHRSVRVEEVEPAELASTVDGHDLVAVSVVQSADGTLTDLDALRVAAERTGARVLLDASQALGWLPLRLDWADYVACAGYKWLFSPRGAAWLAVRDDALADITPINANWYAGRDRWNALYGSPLRLADSAARLDLSPVWFSHVGAAAALEWLDGLDLAAVRAHCVGLANEFRAALGLPASDSAIVTVATAGAADRLAAAGVATAVRDGRVRVAFALYNDHIDVRRAVDALRTPAG